MEEIINYFINDVEILLVIQKKNFQFLEYI